MDIDGILKEVGSPEPVAQEAPPKMRRTKDNVERALDRALVEGAIGDHG